METQQLPICCVCCQPTQQILLLRCSHNPCVGCAANLTNRGLNEECECPICNITTKLEPTTIMQLKRHRKQVSHCKSHSVLDYHASVKKVVRLTNTQANRSTHLTENESKDEAFCFGCWKFISLEHMMLDSHRNHEVKMISKGFTKLKVILEDKEDALQRRQDQISRMVIDTEHQKLQCQETLNFKKREIIEACSKLKAGIEHLQEKAIVNLFDSHRGYLKHIDQQLRKLKSRTCEMDLLKNQIIDVGYKIGKADKTAFEDLPKLNIEIQSQLNIPPELKISHRPNIEQFSISSQALNQLIRKISQFQMFGRISQTCKTLQDSYRHSAEVKQTRQNNFFDELKTKFYNAKNNTSFDEVKPQKITLKTQSSEKHLHSLNKSILTERRNKLNLTEEPLQITKNKIKRQLGQPLTLSTHKHKDKENLKIML